MRSSTVVECGPLPHVHLEFTRRYSHDMCSQAFSALPLPCIILNTNQRTKNGGGLGMRLLIHLLIVSSSYSPPILTLYEKGLHKETKVN